MLNDIDITHVIPVKVRKQHVSKGCHTQVPLLAITIPAKIGKQHNIKAQDTILLVANEKEIKIYTKDEYMKRLSD